MSLTTHDKQDIRTIVDEAVKGGIAHLPTVEMVRDIVKEETAHLPTVEMVRDIVKEETAHLPTVDAVRGIVKEEIGESMISGPLKRALTSLEEKIDSGIYKIEIMYEDTRSDIKAMSEMLSDNLKVKRKVDDHEYRLIDIETVQPMMIKTLKAHSKQLKAQG